MTLANSVVPATVFPEAAALVAQGKLRDFNERLPQLREMLLIGLAAYGEVERLSDEFKSFERCNIALPKDLRVIHPTGCSDTVCDFADALRSLDSITFDVIQIALAERRATGNGQNLDTGNLPSACQELRPKVVALPSVENPAAKNFFTDACASASNIASLVRTAHKLLISEDIDQRSAVAFDACNILEEAVNAATRLSGECLAQDTLVRGAA